MKYIVACLMLTAFSAQALPLMPVKDRLKLELWSEGIQSAQVSKPAKEAKKPLPEEITRILNKFKL